MNHSEHHNHDISQKNERKTFVIIIITLITMAAEIGFGYFTKSMALLADGYHMGTHAIALGLTFMAYVLSRKYKDSEAFPNGTDKIGVLAGYTSSFFLGATGIWIIIEAIIRFINPLQIKFDEAALIASIGLVVNVVCIFIMEYKHSHHEEKTHKDYNFMAAYYHILADAMTSILAIIALLAGKYFNLVILDPIIGIFGGILILKWAWNIIKDTVKILVDMK